MKITSKDIDAALAKQRKAKRVGTWHGFAALVRKLRGRKGVRTPKALAAFIGRKKFGRKAFAALGQAGRRGMTRE